MKFLIYCIFRIVVLLFRLVPFWFLYRLSDFLFWLLFYVFKYRRKVVRANLEACFPDKDVAVITGIERRFYQHLCDIILEGIKGLTLSKKEIVRRYNIINIDEVDIPFIDGKSSMFVGGHYGNWEWGAIGATLQVQAPVTIFFQPIKNPYVNNYIKKTRIKHRTDLRSIRETSQTFLEKEAQPVLYIMIADQSPSNIKQAHWVEFLGRDTAVLHGPAKYAKRYDLPMYWIETQRVKRGFYKVQGHLITTTPNDFSEEDLTKMWMQRLEQMIENRPEHWLWSHRRWKHQRTNNLYYK